MGPRAGLTLGVVGSGPWRQPVTPVGQARMDTGRSQDQCTPGRQREACGGPNTHPHLTTQRASVHAGPGARAGPTAGPPRPPDLMGSHGETGVLPAAGLAAIVDISHYAKRPREARERGLCDKIHINVHGDKPRMHSHPCRQYL